MTIDLQKDKDHFHYLLWTDEDLIKLEKRVLALENTLKNIGIDIAEE
jgi:hypothetical protein